MSYVGVGDVLWWIAVVIVGVLGAGRLTRLVTHDSFPPAVWFRQRWDRITNDGPWGLLAHCHWCASPWIFLGVGLWGFLSDFHWTWWAFWGWLAGSYLVAMIVERDEPADGGS